MNIYVDGRYWHCVHPGYWTPLAETPADWTPEPAPERIEEMQRALKAAHAADHAAFEEANPNLSAAELFNRYFDVGREQWDAVAASFGGDYDAMAAYQDYRECAIESLG